MLYSNFLEVDSSNGSSIYKILNFSKDEAIKIENIINLLEGILALIIQLAIANYYYTIKKQEKRRGKRFSEIAKELFFLLLSK